MWNGNFVWVKLIDISTGIAKSGLKVQNYCADKSNKKFDASKKLRVFILSKLRQQFGTVATGLYKKFSFKKLYVWYFQLLKHFTCILFAYSNSNFAVSIQNTNQRLSYNICEFFRQNKQITVGKKILKTSRNVKKNEFWWCCSDDCLFLLCFACIDKSSEFAWN